MADSNRRIAAIAKGQLGAFTREQAVKAGVSSTQLRGWTQSNRLDKNGFRTYRNPMMATSIRTDLNDLMLDVAPAWVCGPTAAAVHGLDGFVLRRPFHVVVKRGRNIQRVGAHIHSTTLLDAIDCVIVDGIPVTSASRTLIDLAPRLGESELLAAVASAFRDGTSSEAFLYKRLLAVKARGRSGSRDLLATLEGHDLRDGRRSWLERRFLEMLASSGLPEPRTEVVLTKAGDKLVRVDCWFEGTKVVVELLGYRWHRTREQMWRDAERLNQLMLEGYVPLQFTYDQVTNEPDDVIAVVRRALLL